MSARARPMAGMLVICALVDVLVAVEISPANVAAINTGAKLKHRCSQPCRHYDTDYVC